MSVSLKESYDIAYDGSENAARMDLFIDASADLTDLTHFDSVKLLQGSTAEDISTGDKYMMQTGGTWVLQPSSNTFQNVYTKAEVDNMYNTLYQTMLYYHTTLTSIDGTITFYAFSGFIASLIINGNGSQQGTPTPDNPVMPTFCGKLVGSDWTIPISCGGETTPVYLGEVPTVRKIKKLILTGDETVYVYANANVAFRINTSDAMLNYRYCLCTHFPYQRSPGNSTIDGATAGASDYNLYFTFSASSAAAFGVVAGDTNSFKSFLSQQYQNGTPVTIWYVLATPQTVIVNEPLCKIVDYADELHLTSADIQIPTADGVNTLTVDTDLPPSLIEISGER